MTTRSSGTKGVYGAPGWVARDRGLTSFLSVTINGCRVVSGQDDVMPRHRTSLMSASRWPSIESIRASLWVLPSLTGAVSLGLALALLRVRQEPALLTWIEWPGDRESASAVLQTIAGSVITVTSLALSLVVIALQLASQQFSPRLLRQFVRDPIIQVVLAVLIATFVFALTTLRGLNTEDQLPEVSLFVVFLLSLGSMAALVGFISHMVRLLRVDTMMMGVHGETHAVLERFYRPYDDPPPRPDNALTADRRARSVVADRSGFLRRVDVDGVAEAAARAGALVELAVRPGDHVARGTPVAHFSGTVSDPGTLDQDVRRCLELGYERTPEQDAALGFRQLSDIAVKALSPGINDPGTAAHAVGYLADLLIRLCGLSLGPRVHFDSSDSPRVIVPGRDLRYYLDLSCGLVRRFARREPIVLVALLRMLRDVAASTRDPEQSREVARQVDLVLDEMAPDLIDEDAEAVRDMARRVEAVLSGDLGAFDDRSGETRST